MIVNSPLAVPDTALVWSTAHLSTAALIIALLHLPPAAQYNYSHSRFNILSEVFYPLFYLYIITILRKINPKKWLSKILVRFWYADIESRKFNLIFTKPPLQFKFCKVVYLLLSLLNSAITLCTVSICVSLRLDTFIVLSLATPSK